MAEKKQLAMVIDLQKCVGCGACAIACKTENNTQASSAEQTYNWADFVYKTEGTYPDVKYTPMPVLCNHCEDAACIKVCPEPKALYKTEEGITMYNYKNCIQCQKCQGAKGAKGCPYSSLNVKKQGVAYSVISFNKKDGYDAYRDKTELIKGCTASGAEVASKTGNVPPHKNAYTAKGFIDARKEGYIEKCFFCVHRTKNGELPWCVASCPAKARIFGDKNDPNSEVSRLLKKHKPVQLKNNKGELLKEGEKGTKPNVYYIRSFKKA
jgi:Fe-S-cluster-containing dehydrogenase component